MTSGLSDGKREKLYNFSYLQLPIVKGGLNVSTTTPSGKWKEITRHNGVYGHGGVYLVLRTR